MRARAHVLASDLMTTKITLLLVALLLVPACMTKKPAPKPKDAGAESADPGAAAAEARKAGDGTDPTAGKPGDLVIRPLEKNISYRTASAREVVNHWRKSRAGKRG